MPIKPGIYPDLSNKKYHTDLALSHSGMENLAKTPAHFKASRDKPSTPTTAMIVGSAFHCQILEPELFDSQFIIWPKGYRRKTDEIETAKANDQEWVPKENAKDGGYDDILLMEDAIKSHPVSSALLSGGEAEGSYFWQNELGFICKVRPDYKKDDVLIDLKTTQDASPIGFAKTASNFGYIRQAAFYMTGVAACGVSVEQFVFIAIEKKPPYAIGIYIVDDEDLIIAHEENEWLAAKYGECLKADKWPGYSENIEVLRLPPFHKPLII